MGRDANGPFPKDVSQLTYLLMICTTNDAKTSNIIRFKLSAQESDQLKPGRDSSTYSNLIALSFSVALQWHFVYLFFFIESHYDDMHAKKLEIK